MVAMRWTCVSSVWILLISSTIQDGSTDDKHPSDGSGLVFLVLSQSSPYHVTRSAAFREHITRQADEQGLTTPEVILLHERWPQAGSWTLMPVLHPLRAQYGRNSSWILVCEEESRVRLDGLVTELDKYDSREEWFLGSALRDRQATIIHHFAFHEDPEKFVYPDTAACFAVTTTLWNKLADRATKMPKKPDFSIDMKHEFALFVWDHGSGHSLTHLTAFCTTDTAPHCVTKYTQKIPHCGPSVKNSDIFFAIKTCSKFHKDRAKVVQETWGKHAKNLEFYSERHDSSVPTVDIGVPNTERGHCAKTMAILRRALDAPKSRDKPWLVVADDDTILSVTRLRQVLSCYDSRDMIALGERYAYGVQSGYGYDYITGGGSMVFSQSLVEELVTSGKCHCPSDDSPDDMTLGMCLRTLRVPVLHSPLFHQARPEDYAEGYLAHQLPVSFHKHWMIDPVNTYNTWFAEADGTVHDEL